jgi:hypothetical protein
MQAIVEWLKGLFETLKSLNYERLFVVSVVVATLAGSLYVYLVDVHFAPAPDQAQAVDPLVAERLAPLGRLTLAEPVVAAPAVEPDEAAANPATGSATGAPTESPAEGVVTDRSASDAGSTQAAAISESPTEPTMDPIAAGVAVSASPDEAQHASTEADGAVPVAPEPSVPSADRPMTGAAAVAELPGPVQAYPPVPPGYMPMPAPGYAPGYPPYQAPPAAARQAPGVPSGYAPGPYRAYPPTLYERSVAPPNGYPPPQGWAR